MATDREDGEKERNRGTSGERVSNSREFWAPAKVTPMKAAKREEAAIDNEEETEGKQSV